jgi:beta-fructofuranosidase
MYYCAGDSDHTRYKIHLATSRDLVTWTRHPKNPMVVDGYDARDPFVMRVGDKWVLYYTATSDPSGGHHVVACVTSDDLVTWGNRRVVYTDPEVGTYGGPTESPFVVRRGKSFYLFVGPRPEYDGTDVFVSRNPFLWRTAGKVGHIRAHAAEVIRDADGKWYISRCGWGERGVSLAPLTWKDGEDDSDTSLPPPTANRE